MFQNAIKPIKQGGLGFNNHDVILFGKSIGTGPATLLAGEFQPRALVILSAYTTVKKAAAHVAGRFLALFLNEHFNNLENIRNTRCPVLIIHGEKDKLIPVTHGRALHKAFFE